MISNIRILSFEVAIKFFKRNDLAKPGRKFAFRQIAYSVLMVLGCTLVSFLCCGKIYATSAITGGAIGVLPNIIFAYKAFKYAGAKSSRLVMESFFAGEKIKMVLTVVLFALAFKFIAIVPVPFFTTFCLVMVMPLLTPFLFKL